MIVLELKIKPLPSLEIIESWLAYEQIVGLFTWKISPANSIRSGDIAGNINKGYRVIQIGGEAYKASRLAFKIMVGRDPVAEIDHRDGDQGNDAWLNLREATHQQNIHNRRVMANSKSHQKGASPISRSKKWQARISLNGAREHLGVFDTAEEAHAAYCEAARRKHGDFYRNS